MLSCIAFTEMFSSSTDVQDAIHAPHIEWQSCTDNTVYINPVTGGPGRDTSIPSTLSVLPNVIDKSVRTVIVHGLAVSVLYQLQVKSKFANHRSKDFILVAEGTRIAIQYVSTFAHVEVV